MSLDDNPHPFGYCRRCKSPIQYPGLSDSFCPRHGWISTGSFVVPCLDFDDSRKSGHPIAKSPTFTLSNPNKAIKNPVPVVQQINLLESTL